MNFDKVRQQVEENASEDRFFTMGSHIGDNENEEWAPQACSYLAAKLICDKLNSLNNKLQNE